MAFQRLRVERSPGAVWFGAVMMVFAFAGAQASSDGKFWRPQYIAPTGYVYLGLMLLGAYLVFRGLYGAWWREVRVDPKARTLKTCLGEVVPLDDLGELTITDGGLHAAGAKTPVYRTSKADAERVRLLIEPLTNPGGPKRLVRLRRLTYHRSIALFIFTLVGFAMLVAVFVGEAHTTMRELSYEPEYKLMLLLGFTTCFLWFRRALFGTYSRHQLFVDPAAGVLRLEDGTFRRLDELGALSIKKVVQPPAPRRRYSTAYYHLAAENVTGWLYSSMENEGHTKGRLDALATAVLQFQLRRVLEAPHVEGDAFRGGLDPKDEATRVAGDSPYKRAALEALTRDPDPTVQSRAAALL